MLHYVIVDSADITNSMINLSFSRCSTHIRKNNSGTKSILKFDSASEYNKEIFSSYIWYDKEEIGIKLLESEWISDSTL